ncbi:hypothetical protein HDV00_004075 [Rhizophlyctis rosea]|nr:hypothetical protein HDV00_004075 [Rhizophlyctis rosea]
MLGTPEEYGIIPLAIADIFKRIMKSPDVEFLLRISYLEIYNEVIRDLLKPGNDNLKIHESTTRGIYVGDLTEHIVMSLADVEQAMMVGEGNRHVGETNMNEKSSRSHTILRMVIESREKSMDKPNDSRVSYSGVVRVSTLNLVDLAGSERVGHTGAEGIRLKEGGHINKSLLTLGTVISKLSDGGDRVHIPYRDSKLTRILQPSLGGNARTAIICTITPASSHVDETVSTLKFASRAKTITNRPEVNEILTDEALIKQYRKEINNLKRQLDEVKNQDYRQELIVLESQKMKAEEANEIIQRRLREQEEEKVSGHERSARKHTLMICAKLRATRRQTWFPGAKGLRQVEDETDLETQSDPSDRDEAPSKKRKVSPTKASPVRNASPVRGTNKKQVAFVQDSQPADEMMPDAADEDTSVLQMIRRICEGEPVASAQSPDGDVLPPELQTLKTYIDSLRQGADEATYIIDQSAARHAEDIDFLQVELSTLAQSHSENKSKYEQIVADLRREIEDLKSQVTTTKHEPQSTESVVHHDDITMTIASGDLTAQTASDSVDAQPPRDTANAADEDRQSIQLQLEHTVMQMADLQSENNQLLQRLDQTSKRYNEELARLQNDLENLKRDKEACRQLGDERIRSVQDELTSSETKLAALREEKEAAESEVEQLKLTEVQRMKEKEELGREIETMRASASEAARNQSEIIQELENQFQIRWEGAESELRLVTTELEEVRSLAQFKTEENAKLETRLQQVENGRADGDTAHHEEVDKLKKQLDVAQTAFTAQKDSLEEKLHALEAQLTESRDSLTKLEEELDQSRKERDASAEGVELACSLEERQRALSAQLDTERAAWEVELSEKISEIKRLETALERSQLQSSEQEQLRQQYEEEKADWAERLHAAVVEKEQLNAAVERQQEQASVQIQQIRDELQRELASRQVHWEERWNEINAQKEKLQSDLRDKGEEMSARELEIHMGHKEELERERKGWEEMMKKAVMERQEVESQLAQQVNIASEKAEEAQVRLKEELKGALESLRQSKVEAEQFCRKVKSLSAELKEATALEASLSGIIEQQIREINALKEQLAERLDEEAKAGEETRTLKEEVLSLKKEVQHARSEAEKQCAAVERLSSEGGTREKELLSQVMEAENSLASVAAKLEETQKELEIRNDQLQGLEDMVRTTEEDREREQSLQTQLNDFRIQVDNLKAALVKQTEKNAALEESNVTLADQCSDFEEALTNAKSSLEESQSRLTATMQNVEALERVVKEKESETMDLRNEINNVQQRYSEILNTLEEQEREIDQLRSGIKSKEETMQLQENCIQEQGKKIAALKSSLQEVEEARTEAQARWEAADHEHSALIKECEELRSRASEHTAVMARLQQMDIELETQAADVKELQSRLLDSQESGRQLQVELDGAKAREADAMKKGKKILDQHLACADIIASLEAQVRSGEERQLQASAESELTKRDLAAIQRHADDLKHQLEQHEEHARSLEEHIQNLTIDLRNSRGESETLANASKTSKDTILSLNEEISDLSAAMERLEKRNQNLELEKKKLEADTERFAKLFETKMEEADAGAMSTNLELQKYRAEASELKLKLSKYENMQTNFDEQLHELRQQMLRETEDHATTKASLATRDEEVASLLKSIASENESRDNAERLVSQKMHQLEEQVTEGQKMIASLRIELQDVSAKSDELEGKLVMQQTMNADILERLKSSDGVSSADVLALVSANAAKSEKEFAVMKKREKTLLEKLAQEQSQHEKEKRRLLNYIDQMVAKSESFRTPEAAHGERNQDAQRPMEIVQLPSDPAVDMDATTTAHVASLRLPEECDGELLVLETVRNDNEKLRIENEKLRRELKTQNITGLNDRQELLSWKRNHSQLLQQYERLKLHVSSSSKEDSGSPLPESTSSTANNGSAVLPAEPTPAIRHGRTAPKENRNPPASIPTKDAESTEAPRMVSDPQVFE